MEHVVFYPSAQGTPAFARVASLEEATSFVEHLRNSDGLTDFSVYALTAVPLAFRAYYHVEVPASEDDKAAPAAEETPAPAAETEVAEPEDAQAAEVVEDEPVAVVEDEPVAVVEDEPAAVADDADEVTKAPVEAAEEDRSAEWVAEAVHVEPPVEEHAEAEAEADAEAEAEAVAAAPEPKLPVAPKLNTPFAEAPPVTPEGPAPAIPVPAVETDVLPEPDAIPVPSGRRSMGFFAR